MPDEPDLRLAPIFAALGDPTRLRLIDQLCRRGPRSIAELTEGSGLTRQAITKHLRVLEAAELVRSVRSGRTNLFVFRADRIAGLRAYFNVVSKRWDEALARLEGVVEE